MVPSPSSCGHALWSWPALATGLLVVVPASRGAISSGKQVSGAPMLWLVFAEHEVLRS
jgi:hypothetical protein